MKLNFRPLTGKNLSADIVAQLREKLSDRSLCAGDRLPSSRELARQLGVARGTVITALDTLTAEGVFTPRTGSGTYVSSGCEFVQCASAQPRQAPSRAKRVMPDIDAPFSGRLNFQACRPSLEAFPQMAWRRAAADAASRLPSPDYGDPQGEPELRHAIAAYLCRARGLDVSPDEIIITNGAIQAMHLLATMYLTPAHAVAVENPGYPLARQVFAMTGARIVPVAVDDQGLRVDDLPDGGDLKFVYVTPSHQFPTGQRLSLQRRQRLLEWAAGNDVLILEDDYDGEFRYDVAPLPPMAAMPAGGSVVYFGTFSKTLYPGLRLGFAAGAKELIRDMANYRAVADYQTSALSQLTLARFIENGQFEKHVHRMRRLYAKKRACLARAIDETGLPGTLTGTDSGLNALVRLDTAVSATLISAVALERGVCVTPIARYSASQAVADNALVLGYAALSEEAIRDGVEILAAIIREVG